MLLPTLKPDTAVIWANELYMPLVTFEDKVTGDRAQVVIDDKSFVLLLKSKGTIDEYLPTHWWFPEAIVALHEFLLRVGDKEVSQNTSKSHLSLVLK